MKVFIINDISLLLGGWRENEDAHLLLFMLYFLGFEG
jgi:hypothetical protein